MWWFIGDSTRQADLLIFGCGKTPSSPDEAMQGRRWPVPDPLVRSLTREMARPAVYPPHSRFGQVTVLLANFQVGIDRPMFLIAGPCVIEGETLTQEIAGTLKDI